MIRSLKALYWLAFFLEIVSTVVWVVAAGATALLTLIPAGLTIWLFIIHKKSYHQLNAQGYVSTNLMRSQMTLSISIACALTAVVVFLDSLDCLTVCKHDSNHYLTSTLPSAAFTFLIALSLAVLPYFLNRKLAPQPKTTSK